MENRFDKKFNRVVEILEKEYALKKTIEEESCVDRDGNPIPWYTYPAIEYLLQLDFSDKRIFEFGAGNSTLFWANLSAEVVSVEDNKSWYKSLKKKIPSNVELKYKQLGEKYTSTILKEKGEFDVIIVDGRMRDKCCESAIQKIASGGLIILDNSDRASEYKEYSDAIRTLNKKDMIQVDFFGFGPINDYTWTTSIFFSRDFDFKPINGEIRPVKDSLIKVRQF
jgi:predicted O-methyltransferase YrrM